MTFQTGSKTYAAEHSNLPSLPLGNNNRYSLQKPCRNIKCRAVMSIAYTSESPEPHWELVQST